MATYTRWYRAGEITCTKNSTAITGTDTEWAKGQISPGDMFTTDNGESFYEIESITDDTHLTLKTPYRSDSKANSGYGIIRQFNATMSAKVASWASKLLLDFDEYINTDLQRMTGKSAYEVAVEAGYTGTKAEWLESLKAAGEWVATKAKCEGGIMGEQYVLLLYTFIALCIIIFIAQRNDTQRALNSILL